MSPDFPYRFERERERDVLCRQILPFKPHHDDNTYSAQQKTLSIDLSVGSAIFTFLTRLKTRLWEIEVVAYI